MEIRAPDVNRTEVDGIPAFWLDAPRPFTVGLTFRVGYYDETLAKRGITHLVEHLAMFPNRDAELGHNAYTGPQLTTFWAQGHPDLVGRLLRDVCHTLHHLPLGRLDIEADVLEREEATDDGANHFDRVIWSYFGPYGPGLGVARQMGLGWLGADELERWADRHFTRGNAALVIFGKPPESFGLELPDGPRIPYLAPPMARPVPEQPTQLDTNPDGVTWATLVRQTGGEVKARLSLANDIVARRLRDRMRHDLGRTYAIGQGDLRIDAALLALTHGFACEPSMTREVAIEHHEIMAAFLDDGPNEEELESSFRRFLNLLEDYPVDVAKAEAWSHAETELAEWGPPIPFEEWADTFLSATAEEVRDRFAEAYRQSYTVADLPDGLMQRLSSLFPPEPSPLAGARFEKTSKKPNGLAREVRVGPLGVSLTYKDGWANLEIDQIALVALSDGFVSIDAAMMSIDLETNRYSPNRTKWLDNKSRWLIGGGLAVSGAFLSFLSPWQLVAALLVLVGAFIAVTGLTRSDDESEIDGRALTLTQAVERYLPAELFLPAPRVPRARREHESK